MPEICFYQEATGGQSAGAVDFTGNAYATRISSYRRKTLPSCHLSLNKPSCAAETKFDHRPTNGDRPTCET
jgi:hypothetical protein